jgi:alpha-galactosidase
MMAWVTDSPNWYNGRSTSLTYRFLSAMQGSLGIGANLDKWTPEDFANARHLIGVYKEIRGVVQKGMLYRLVSPRDGSNVSATESVSPDRRSAVVFGFLHSQQMGYPFPTIFPRGLDKNAVYSIEAIGGKIMDGTPKQASGAYWMSHGIDFPLKGDFAAEGALLKSERVD